MIVTCQKCGTSIPPDDVLCGDCGNTCLACRTPIRPGDSYCDECVCPQCHTSKSPDDRLCPDCQDIEDEATADEDSPSRDYCTTMLYEEEAHWDDD
jgi:hypothetical protein